MKKHPKPKAPLKSGKNEIPSKRFSTLLWTLIIIVVTFIVYHSVTSFDMTNWDDKAYLKETPMIRDLTFENVKSIFSQKVLNSYNPVVLLSFAIDNQIAKLNPHWCHKVNLFFHILNALLVFVCMRKLKFKTTHAGIIAILFSIHPLATEAVSWIAGRKDVLYLFFYLLSWNFYLDFYHSKRKRFLLISLVFFIISLLSKVQALTLPLILIASDLMLDQKFEIKKLLNKIPFFLLSLIFGLIAISGSDQLVADKYSVPINFFEKIIYSIMAFGLYVQKILFPLNQTAIYQFPPNGSSEYLWMLIAGIIWTLIIVISFFKLIKNNPRFSGAILFFSFAIFPVLHIVAVNSALIYERFVYLADIGIFMAIFALIEKSPKHEPRIIYLSFAVCILLSTLSYARIPVWKNSISLWTDIIQKDSTASDAYTNRGQYFEENGDYEKAFADFSESIKLQPNKPGGYHNRAVIYFKKGEYTAALNDNLKVLEIDSTHTDALYNRGAIFFNMNSFDSSIFYYNKAIYVSPHLSKNYFGLGVTYYKMNNFKQAAANFKRASEEVKDYTDAYIYRALSDVYLGLDIDAEEAISISEKLDPRSAGRNMLSLEYVRFGNTIFQSGQLDSAMTIFRHAAEIDPNNAEAYYNIGGMYFVKKDIPAAREYWQKALTINPNHAESKTWLGRTGGLN